MSTLSADTIRRWLNILTTEIPDILLPSYDVYPSGRVV
jgi:hypothetical protein